MGDLINQLFQFLQQLILPNWSDLIALLPWVLLAILVLSLLWLAWAWRRAGSRNRSRVPQPLLGGAPPAGVHLPGPSRWPFVAPVGAALMLFSIVLPPKDAAGNTIGLFNFWLFLLGLVVTLIAIIGWLRDAGREWRAAAQLQTAHAAALPAGSSAAMTLVPAGAVARPRPGAFGAAQKAVEEPTEPEPPPGVHLPGPSPWPFLIPIGATVMLYGFIFSAVLIVGGLILTLIAITGWYLDAGREYFTTEEVGHAVPKTRDPAKAWPRRLVPIYVGVIVVSFAIALAPLGLNYLNSLTPPAATPKAPTVPANPQIAAKGVAFDTKNLVVPAGRAFDLTFTNNDAGVPHNVQIADSSAKTTILFDGDVITGVTTATYHVPALQPGTYYFLCKVHPNMNGSVTAAPEAGGPPPGGPPASVGAASPAPAASKAP